MIVPNISLIIQCSSSLVSDCYQKCEWWWWCPLLISCCILNGKHFRIKGKQPHLQNYHRFGKYFNYWSQTLYISPFIGVVFVRNGYLQLLGTPLVGQTVMWGLFTHTLRNNPTVVLTGLATTHPAVVCGGAASSSHRSCWCGAEVICVGQQQDHQLPEVFGVYLLCKHFIDEWQQFL